MERHDGAGCADLEPVVQMVAEGIDLTRVLRHVARAAALGTGGRHAVVVGDVDGEPVTLAHHGTELPVLVGAATEALGRDERVSRSEPIEHLDVHAVPVRLGSRILAALAVAGVPGRVDRSRLPAAAALAALALGRTGAGDPVTRATDALADVHIATAPEERAGALLDALEKVLVAPAFVALRADVRLRVVRHRGLERDRIAEIVAEPELRALVADWSTRARPAEAPAVVPLEGTGEVLVCASLHDPSWTGLLGVVLTPAEARGVGGLLGAFGRHASAALAAAATRRDLERAGREIDGLTQTIPVPLLMVDEGGRFHRINAPAAQLLGLSSSFDVGRCAAGSLGSPELERLVLEHDAPAEATVELGSPPRRFRARVGQVHDGERLVRRVLTLEDVSSHEESRRIKEEFVAVAGHELRTPLTLIRGFAQTLLKQGDRLPGERREEFLGKLLGQSDRLHHLIEDLLFMSTERDARVGLDVAEHDLPAVVAGVLAPFATTHPDREISVVHHADDLDGWFDAARVGQVLRHLVDNAVKYSQGPVTVELGSDPTTLSVAVVDRGPGIYSGDVERIFRPFEQLDPSSTRARGGTGIGLHIAARLVAAMGGRLDVDSRLAQGSRFSFRLPRSPARHAPGPPQADEPRPGDGTARAD